MSEERLDTAHEVWDRLWGDAEQRARWSHPEPAVTDFIPMLQARGAVRVLDVGAGIGRHALVYARVGSDVTAIDASPAGLDRLVRAAWAEGLAINALVAAFGALPLDDGVVDHLLAWNVLYHGDGAVLRSALAECRRVVRPGGTVQLTVLSKRNRAFGVGREIRPDTFVDDDSAGDKKHPHFYTDADGLAALLARSGFEVLSMVDTDQNPPGGWHWIVLAQA